MKTTTVKQFEAKNQFVILGPTTETLRSYNSIIAIKDNIKDIVFVDPIYCQYSKTTARCFHLWIGNNLYDEIKKHIKKCGSNKITDLVSTYTTVKFKNLNK